MADEKERVDYSFTGDVSSLRNATQEAINLLGKYGEAMANAAKRGSFNASMDNMKTRMNGVFGSVTAKLRSFSSAFDNTGAKMQSFKDRAANAFSRASQLAGTCASAFRRTSQEADKDSASAVRSAQAHRTLGDVLSGIAAKFKSETKAVSDEDSELESKNRTLKTSHSSHSKLLQVLTSLGTKFKSEGKNIQNFTQKLTRLNGVSSLLKKGFQLLTGVSIGDWLASATKEAINYTENLNLFTVAMGSSIDKGMEFVSKMQEVYGMDPSNLYRYAGYFYQLTDAIGMTDNASAALSLSMTKAANDIASLFNKDIGTVVDDLAAGMQGMSRAVRKYGMDIRATTLQTTAYKYGLTGQVETMSEANRMALRYLTMMEQVKNATQQVETSTDGATSTMGDFARTIETPANQLRIFKEQMSQLGRAIGNFIAAPLAKAMAYINGFIMALRMLLNFIASSFRLLNTSIQKVDTSGADKAADAVNNIGTAAGSAAKKLKDLTAPFDELNVLQEQTASGGGSAGGISADVLDPALEKALTGMELKLEDIKMRANEVRDSILTFLGFKIDAGEIISWSSKDFEKNLINKFPEWTKTIKRAFTLWGDLSKSLEPIFDLLGGAIRRVVEDLVRLFGVLVNDNTVSEFIDTFTRAVASLSRTVKSVLTPVIRTLQVVWSRVAEILVSAFELLSNTWKNTLEPVLNAVLKAVGAVGDALATLWEEFVGPVIEHVATGIRDLWTGTIKPIIEKVISIIGGVIEIILALWTNVLEPVIAFLIRTFGPTFKSVFIFIWNVVQQVIEAIGGILDGLLTSLEGVIDFIAGVFTGDWTRAWQGLVNIFVGIGNSIISVFEKALNAAKDIINIFIAKAYRGVVGLINSIGGAIEKVADIVFHKKINLTISAPPFQIPTISVPRIPEMARGGVVTSPTYLLAGEGRYNEAILPLDNSPQMEQLVQRIADAVDRDDKLGNGSGNSPVEVHVYIGGKEYDAFTYKAAKRGERIVGAQLITERG